MSEKEQHELVESVREMKLVLAKLDLAICGSPAIGVVGVVEQNRQLETRVRTLEEESRDSKVKRSTLLWLLSAFGTVAGVVGGYVSQYFKGGT